MEGRANLHSANVKSEIQLPHIAAGVAERVRVIFQQQVFQHTLHARPNVSSRPSWLRLSPNVTVE